MGQMFPADAPKALQAGPVVSHLAKRSEHTDHAIPPDHKNSQPYEAQWTTRGNEETSTREHKPRKRVLGNKSKGVTLNLIPPDTVRASNLCDY